MSVTFCLRGADIDWEAPGDGSYLNLGQESAREILTLLGFQDEGEEMYGEVRGVILRAACKKALENLTQDGPRLGVVDKTPGKCAYYLLPRRPGYLKEKLNQLLQVADHAGDLGLVTWS